MSETDMSRERKELAEKLHEWYLEATKELNPKSFNSKAQKPYEDLTSEQKFIDIYIADSILEYFKTVYFEVSLQVIKEWCGEQKRLLAKHKAVDAFHEGELSGGIEQLNIMLSWAEKEASKQASEKK